MEPDYKEQLRMMTEGLGEWMDRRERKRLRWRIASGVAVVALLVVLQIFFPWRRKEVVVQKEVYYVNESGEVSSERPPVTTDSTATFAPRKKKLALSSKGTDKAGISVDENGVRIRATDDGESATIEIDGGGVRISGVDMDKATGKKESVSIKIDATGVHLNVDED